MQLGLPMKKLLQLMLSTNGLTMKTGQHSRRHEAGVRRRFSPKTKTPWLNFLVICA